MSYSVSKEYQTAEAGNAELTGGDGVRYNVYDLVQKFTEELVAESRVGHGVLPAVVIVVDLLLLLILLSLPSCCHRGVDLLLSRPRYYPCALLYTTARPPCNI